MGSPFDKLPVELIQNIAAVSPLHAAAALSFACKRLHNVLGDQYWISLFHQKDRQQSELKISLHHLMKDTPGHRWCFPCFKFHPLTSHEQAYDAEKSRPCFNAKITGNMFVRITTLDGPFRINFPHVQLVMDRHEFGPAHGAPLEILNFWRPALSKDDHIRMTLSRSVDYKGYILLTSERAYQNSYTLGSRTLSFESLASSLSMFASLHQQGCH